MKDICEATQLSGEEELEVSQKSSLTRPFFLEKVMSEDQNSQIPTTSPLLSRGPRYALYRHPERKFSHPQIRLEFISRSS